MSKKFRPQFCEWEFSFVELTSVRVVRNFLNDPDEDKLNLGYPIKIMGSIVDSDKFEDLSEIKTSDVVTLEKVKKYSGYDMLCATTISGSKYYFQSNKKIF